MERERKQIEEMAKDILGINPHHCDECDKCRKYEYDECDDDCFSKMAAKYFYDLGYRKIPEGAVVLTKDELDEELDACKIAMIVHDDDGERYVSYDDYKEFTGRLGKLCRQRKAKIQELEEEIRRLKEADHE